MKKVLIVVILVVVIGAGIFVGINFNLDKKINIVSSDIIKQINENKYDTGIVAHKITKKNNQVIFTYYVCDKIEQETRYSVHNIYFNVENNIIKSTYIEDIYETVAKAKETIELLKEINSELDTARNKNVVTTQNANADYMGMNVDEVIEELKIFYGDSVEIK